MLPNPNTTMDEVEAYIYTVGILIRLGKQGDNKWVCMKFVN